MAPNAQKLPRIPETDISSRVFLHSLKDLSESNIIKCDDDLCSMAVLPMNNRQVGKTEKEGSDNVCIVSPTAKSKFKKKVYAVSVDSSGNSSRKILENPKDVYCRYTAPNIYSSNSWTPFFNEMLIAEDNSTIFEHGQIKITVVRLGSEPCTFYPFGEEKTSIKMPSNITLTIREDGMEPGSKAKTVKVMGTVKNLDDIYTVSFDESEVEDLSSPMIVSSEVDQ